jgi:hypothetical protein
MTKEQLKNLYGNALAFWAINKHLARLIGLESTLLLQHLVDLDFKPNPDKFKNMIHPSYPQLSEDLNLSVKKIQKLVKELKDLELIEIVFIGQPGQNHYRINYLNIDRIMKVSSLPDFVQARDTIFGMASKSTNNNLV